MIAHTGWPLSLWPWSCPAFHQVHCLYIVVFIICTVFFAAWRASITIARLRRYIVHYIIKLPGSVFLPFNSLFFCPLFVSSFFLPSFLKTKLGCGGRLYCPIVEVKERKDCEDEKYERGIGFEWFTLPELASWNRIKMIGTHIRQKDHQKVPFCLLFLWIDLEAWTIPLMVDLLWYSDSTVDSVVKSENTTI